MRVFIALPLEVSERLRIANRITEASRRSTSGNFTKTENLHLTIEFIGEVDQAHLTKLKEIIRDFSFTHFSLQATSLSTFHHHGSQTILYMQLENEKAVLTCVKQCRIALREAGFTVREEAFVPHITLGRKVVMPSLEEYVKIPIINETVHFEAISLMESIRLEEGLVYREIERKAFKQ